MLKLFKQATFLDLWRAATSPLNRTNQSEDIIESGYHLVLLKFADAIFHKGSLHLKGLGLEYFIPIFADTVERLVALLFANPTSFSSSEINDISASMGLLLGIFEAGLHVENSCLSWEDYNKLTVALVGTTHLHSMLTVDFLGLLHKYIPIRGLSRPSVSAADPLPSSISSMFKGMKRDVIIILTLLLHLHKPLQNVVREKGGIPIILSQCNIDDDNPCAFLLYDSDN